MPDRAAQWNCRRKERGKGEGRSHSGRKRRGRQLGILGGQHLLQPRNDWLLPTQYSTVRQPPYLSRLNTLRHVVKRGQGFQQGGVIFSDGCIGTCRPRPVGPHFLARISAAVCAQAACDPPSTSGRLLLRDQNSIALTTVHYRSDNDCIVQPAAAASTVHRVVRWLRWVVRCGALVAKSKLP